MTQETGDVLAYRGAREMHQLSRALVLLAILQSSALIDSADSVASGEDVVSELQACGEGSGSPSRSPHRASLPGSHFKGAAIPEYHHLPLSNFPLPSRLPISHQSHPKAIRVGGRLSS